MKKITIILAIVVLLTLALAGSASAITKGQPDGNNHPYVGIALGPATGGGYWVCSAAAISPTVLVTAAHCFETEDVFGSFVEVPPPYFQYTGKCYPDPEWCIGCAGGLPGFDSHDVAVIVLDEPVSLPRYAQLPTEGLVDALPMKTTVDLVGYGLQFDHRSGALVRLAPKVTDHRETVEAARAAVAGHIERHGSISIAELRDRLDLSRKYAQAILEHFDRTGFTRRVGDRHLPVPR